MNLSLPSPKIGRVRTLWFGIGILVFATALLVFAICRGIAAIASASTPRTTTFYPPQPEGIIPLDYKGVIEVSQARGAVDFMIDEVRWSPLIWNVPRWTWIADFPDIPPEKLHELVVECKFIASEGKKVVTLRGDEYMDSFYGNKFRMRGKPAGRVHFFLVPP